MPSFKSRPEVEEADGGDRLRTSPTTSSPRKRSIFASKRGRSLSPTSSNTSKSHDSNPSTHQPGSRRRGGFFLRRSSSTSSDDNRNSLQSAGSRGSGGGGFFGMGHGRGIDRDPTILAARQKVTEAEEAEKEADRALLQARGMVKEAREHIKVLEQEAIEDVRRAKSKQAEAKIVSQVARGLGRHGS